MLRKQLKYTGSTVAKFILNDFENQMKNFVKVFPQDYKKVLAEMKTKPQISNKKEERITANKKI
jgi:glutamate synthase (NADPH/NADH) large chain